MISVSEEPAASIFKTYDHIGMKLLRNVGKYKRKWRHMPVSFSLSMMFILRITWSTRTHFVGKVQSSLVLK
jgi:hypothetical protein